ncbi:uncharacterized protein LOC127788697 isoform X2 [Diospyros lotus]|uniref:uncharacterized protein LOC127788697 isoform X2 n=1 Tax=Diospyros lotus TaxID=55363 RepID=UPI0022503D6D|nr:uncharacterized protein LOC127788697 isoform X2 [Diospyros lotus]
MEDEKKKKKNKKKKNRQIKTTDDANQGGAESAKVDKNGGVEENHQRQTSEPTDIENDVPDTFGDVDSRHANGTEGSVLDEAEKQYWMSKVAGLEGTVKELQIENDTLVQKEVCLEESIIKLQKENEMHNHKEAILEETIKKLREENDTHMQEESFLKMKLLQLQNEKDSWLQKEGGFEERINLLMDDAANLRLKGASLEEKIKQLEKEKDSWNSTKETIAGLNGDKARLQTQVMELEESRNHLAHENQRLKESMSGLQLQILSFEKSVASARMSTAMMMGASGREDVNAQVEPEHQVAEKLVNENAELAEKVNALYAELDQVGVAVDPSQDAESKLVVGTGEKIDIAGPTSEFREKTCTSGERMDAGAVNGVLIRHERTGDDGANAKDTIDGADSMPKSGERMSVSGGGRRRESLGDLIKAEEQNGEHLYAENTTVIPSLSTVNSEEIVQIPLDENEGAEAELLQPSSNGEDVDKTDVPLTDAPLIGAPFRLISFVARYVSGADLVSKTPVK